MTSVDIDVASGNMSNRHMLCQKRNSEYILSNEYILTAEVLSPKVISLKAVLLA